MWIMGIGWGKLPIIWEFIIPVSARLSDEVKTSIAGGQECNIARPDPTSHLTAGQEDFGGRLGASYACVAIQISVAAGFSLRHDTVHEGR
jgi:hypothetical protein